MNSTPSISSNIQKEDIVINDPLLDHKLDLITAGARPYLKEHLLNKISRENCLIVSGPQRGDETAEPDPRGEPIPIHGIGLDNLPLVMAEPMQIINSVSITRS